MYCRNRVQYKHESPSRRTQEYNKKWKSYLASHRNDVHFFVHCFFSWLFAAASCLSAKDCARAAKLPGLILPSLVVGSRLSGLDPAAEAEIISCEICQLTEAGSFSISLKTKRLLSTAHFHLF
jgi:hypothetical protein